MKKLASVLVVLAAWPLLTAGGGMNPPPPGFKITGPAVNAIFVFDTQTGQAAMRLTKGTLATSSNWVLSETQRTFLFGTNGCTLSLPGIPNLTEARFKDARMTDLEVPNGGVDIMTDLGITVTGANTPILTDVDQGVCSPSSAGTQGVLSFTGVFQFLVPSPNGK